MAPPRFHVHARSKHRQPERNHSHDDLISLGPSCLAAYHFRRGWRKASLPFDWTLFDDRQQHIPCCKACGCQVCPLLSLQNNRSPLHYEPYRALHGTDKANRSVVHAAIPTMRWIHDDPLKNASKVVRRTQRLISILASPSTRRRVFTLAYGSVNELPSPIEAFAAQLKDLTLALESSFTSLIGHYRILIIVHAIVRPAISGTGLRIGGKAAPTTHDFSGDAALRAPSSPSPQKRCCGATQERGRL